jgi:tetratricopeptide (TPR) repeat protein
MMQIREFLLQARNCFTRSAAVLLLLCGALLPAAARAAPVDDAAEVSRLMQAGQLNEAMTRVDAALAQKPGDARLRFSKGMILARQNKPTEAIAILLKLTEDFPDLPEPYNNLAVLYAANGQYESARIALDKAIVNNPGYATAHENLGDVYAELAGQSYDKAAKLDSGNASAKAKTVALRANVLASVPRVALKQPATPTVKNVLAAIDTSTSAAPGTPGTAGPPASKPSAVAVSSADQSAVMTTVAAWADAWSARDVKAYLDFYSPDFVVPRGLNRAGWMAERTSRISSKRRISVKVEEPVVTLAGDSATVQFQQMFVSDKLRSTDRKTLILIRRDGRWRIREERAG